MSAVEHHVIVDDNGRMSVIPADMRIPVECGNCGRVYDLCAGVPLQRYMDCTVFRTPCCGHVTDDRPQGWCEGRGFRRLSIPRTQVSD